MSSMESKHGDDAKGGIAVKWPSWCACLYPNTQEAETRGLQVEGYPGLHREFQARISSLVVFTYIPEPGKLRQEDCKF